MVRWWLLIHKRVDEIAMDALPRGNEGAGINKDIELLIGNADKDGMPGKVERLEYDPNRTANIALICYADGERCYMVAPEGLKAGATVISGQDAPLPWELFTTSKYSNGFSGSLC